MSKIPNIEQFYDNIETSADGSISHKNIALRVIKEYAELVRKETLKVAAAEVKTIPVYEPNCKDHTPFRGECQNCSSYHNYDVLVAEKIDKQSILDLVNHKNLEIK